MEVHTEQFKAKRALYDRVNEILQANGLYYIEEENIGTTLTYWFHDSEVMFKVLKGKDNDKHLRFMTVGDDGSLAYITPGDVLVFEREEPEKVWFWYPKLLKGQKAADAEEAFGFTQFPSLSDMLQQGVITPASNLIDNSTPPPILTEPEEIESLLAIQYGSFEMIERTFKKLKATVKDLRDVTSFTTPEKETSIRILKVKRGDYCYRSHYQEYYKEVPEIQLRGFWLEQAGFMRGESVQVISLKGMMLIVPQRPPKI
jgi:hypothetical protein